MGFFIEAVDRLMGILAPEFSGKNLLIKPEDLFVGPRKVTTEKVIVTRRLKDDYSGKRLGGEFTLVGTEYSWTWTKVTIASQDKKTRVLYFHGSNSPPIISSKDNETIGILGNFDVGLLNNKETPEDILKRNSDENGEVDISSLGFIYPQEIDTPQLTILWGNVMQTFWGYGVHYYEVTTEQQLGRGWYKAPGAFSLLKNGKYAPKPSVRETTRGTFVFL